MKVESYKVEREDEENLKLKIKNSKWKRRGKEVEESKGRKSKREDEENSKFKIKNRGKIRKIKNSNV